MDIQFGTLGNVLGAPARHMGFTFVGADVQLNDRSFTHDFPLRDCMDESAPIALRVAVENHFDAAWVRARVPCVFKFTPSLAEVEKALLDVGFVAVVPDGKTAFPFVCTDHYGKTAIMFSGEGPEESTKRLIAATFWNLLCQDSENLMDFQSRVYHPGAGVWLTYGCEDGHLYCDESEE